MNRIRESATLIDHVVRSVSGILRPGCRILEVREGPARLAPGLAGALPECTVIALDISGERRSRSSPATGRGPKNLAVLTCGIDSANFLANSMTAVVASYPCGDSLLSRLTDCLEPGGRLLLVEAGGNRAYWNRFSLMLTRRNKRPLPDECLASEPAAHPAISIFRKKT